MYDESKYVYGEFTLTRIRNRNETRIIALMPEVLTGFPGYRPEILDIQDIYALTLNKLQPRYTQEGTMVLNEPVSDEVIKRKIEQAVRRVQRFPNHN